MIKGGKRKPNMLCLLEILHPLGHIREILTHLPLHCVVNSKKAAHCQTQSVNGNESAS
jgi:hypothetical protein